ncbi:MAG: hypothetical protein JXA03_04640 [Bacteroidales bacterium]|nr:hypothetical protein [Bacteroidales bacterium]
MKTKASYLLILVLFSLKALCSPDQEKKSDKNAFSLNGELHYAYVKEMP